MTPPSARDLVFGFQKTLTACGVDYEETIREFGQVAASEARAVGKAFGLRDHVRGLLLSQLSNQRPWKPIAQNLDGIRRIFFDYDPDALQQTEPTSLTSAIRSIRCGNRAIVEQMNAIRANISVLRRIEKDFGSLDKFVTSRDSFRIATLLSKSGPYKLRYVGPALALEYLRNVGIRSAKPDLHVLRILGGERLGYFQGRPTEREAVHIIASLAAEVGCNPTYLDNLLWIFCSIGYGNICGASPRCSVCALRDGCRYPANRQGGTLTVVKL